jgi:hypothetical protein
MKFVLPVRGPARYERRAALQGQRHAVAFGGFEIELKRTLTLAFGEFGWRSLAAEARRERRSLEELLSAAAAYFHLEPGTGRARALRVPRAGRHPRGHGSRIELALSAGVWRELEAEAARQRVPLERCSSPAALYYLAAVDSGREPPRPTDPDRYRRARSTPSLSGQRPGAYRAAALCPAGAGSSRS